MDGMTLFLGHFRMGSFCIYGQFWDGEKNQAWILEGSDHSRTPSLAQFNF